jgi:signal transduction histidine kinase
MKNIFRQHVSILLYASLLVSIVLAVWSLLRTETYRQQTELILGQASEIQWRTSQSKDRAARIIGGLNLAVCSGEQPPRLLRDVQLLSFNLKSLARLDYAATFISPRDLAVLHRAIDAVDTVILPATSTRTQYQQATAKILFIDGYLAGLASAAVDHSHNLSATSHIATDAARNRLVFFGALSVFILSVISLDQYSRIRRKNDQHIKSFSMLFAHMTRTRIAALRLFLGYLNGGAPPPPEMTEAALHTIQELNTITEALMTIGHARAETQLVPLGTLIDEIARTCKLNVTVEADREARAVSVPASQFHLVIDELIGNAINAVAAQSEPAIAIRANLRTRLFGRAQLVLTVADNGTGMSSDMVARAKEPFFSTKAGTHVGLGLTNCAELVRTMGGKLDISSTPGKGTAVRITYLI